MAKPKVEITQLIGEFRELSTGRIRRAAWNMDRLWVNGRQVATINRVPGAPIGLLGGANLTPSEIAEVERVVAAARGGVKPSKIGGPDPQLYQLLDDEGEDTELEESDE